MFELVVIWQSGDRDVYSYTTREAAEKAGSGMKMALGNQIAWWCVRKEQR